MTNFDNARKRVLLDFHIPEWNNEILSEFNVKDLVEKYDKYNIDCIFFYAKDHYGHCYYKTDIGHRHKMMEDRDFFGEFIKEAKKKDYITGGYYAINWQLNVADEDYWAKDKNGNYIRHREDNVSRWNQVCYNSQSYLKFCLDQLTEILSSYSLDAIWLDMLNYPFDRIACYCDNCRKAFKEKYGHDNLPPEPSWDKVWRDFLDFRFNANHQFAWNLREHIEKINPEIAIIFNYHGAPKDNWLVGQKPVMHSSYSDYASHEIYPGMFGSMYPSIVPRFLKSLHRGKPVEILTFRFNQRWDYTVKPLAQYKWEIMNAAMHGCHIMTVDQPLHNGKLDEAAYELIKEGYDYIKSKSNLYKGSPTKFSAIYFSQKSRDFYAREDKENYSMSFYGAVKMLIEEHLPVDILFDENIDSIDFNEYRLLVLPNTAILNEVETNKIKKFVSEGGVLIASDGTSLYDENGNKLPNYGLSELFGVDFNKNTDFSYSYFIPTASFSKDMRENHAVLVNGPGRVVEPNHGKVKLSGELKIPLYESSDTMFFSHNLHPPWKKVGYSLIINNYNKGRVFYLPFKIFGSYVNKNSLPEHRKYIRNIIKSLDFKLPFEVDCPLNVDTIINEDKDNFYIHFLGYNPTMQLTTLTGNPDKPDITPPLVMEEPLLYEAKIRSNVPMSGYEIGDDVELVSWEENILKVRINDIYESIKIKK